LAEIDKTGKNRIVLNHPLGNTGKPNLALFRVMLSELRAVTNNFTTPISMKYMVDFRGRIYPMYTAVSHMSHSFIRVLFELPHRSDEGADILFEERSLKIINNILETRFSRIAEAFSFVSTMDLGSRPMKSDAY
jgi:hypothetical protein